MARTFFFTFMNLLYWMECESKAQCEKSHHVNNNVSVTLAEDDKYNI